MTPKTTKETTPPQTSTFLNPFTDYGFKRLFGTEENKNLLIDPRRGHAQTSENQQVII